MFEQVTHNPIYGPQGQTLRVRLYGDHDTLLSDAWFWTLEEALAASDRAHDSGLRVKVDGLPTVAVAAGFSLPDEHLIEITE